MQVEKEDHEAPHVKLWNITINRGTSPTFTCRCFGWEEEVKGLEDVQLHLTLVELVSGKGHFLDQDKFRRNAIHC